MASCHDEFAPQPGDFRGRDVYVAVTQFDTHLVHGAMALEQGPTDIHKDIISDIAACRNKIEQGLGAFRALTIPALPYSLVCDKRSQQTQHGLSSGFLDSKSPAQTGQMLFAGVN